MPIPFQIINLDKPRKLRLGMAASVEFEQTTGIMLMSLSRGLSVADSAKLLWIMLKQDDSTLTLEETIRLVDENSDNLIDIIKIVSKAISAAYNTGKSDPNGKKTASPNS